MAKETDIKIEGVNRTKRMIKLLGDESIDCMKTVFKVTALMVESTAKKLAPVDTGRLRSSIRHKIDDDGLGATVGTDVTYAPHVEYGTVNQRSQPYLRPAWARHKSRFFKDLKNCAQVAGKKVSKK